MEYMEAIATKNNETKAVIIIGRSYLQNNLLSSFVERKTGFISNVVEIESIAIEKIRLELNPQLLLLDCNDINPRSITTVINSLNSTYPNAKIALFNAKKNGVEEDTASSPIVKGIFYHDTNESKLTDGIKSIMNGELWLSRRLISKFYTNKNHSAKHYNHELGLTEREIQIIKMITEGEQNKEIANNLCLSNHTIKSHIYHIYKKLKVSNRTQAANWAQQNLILND